MKGPFLGGVLLIGGSCIGAGMLAIPVMTGLAGFLPSIVILLVAWAFMTATGLLMVEVSGSFSGRVNILSMAGRSFGPVAQLVSSLLYLFLFYSLLVAYIAGSGSVTASYVQALFSLAIPPWIGSFLFAIGLGCLAYRGIGTVDRWNRVFMGGKILTYLGMVLFGFGYVKPDLLSHMQPTYVVYALPVLVIAFGYHNMIPTLMTYMNGDTKRVRNTIVAGTSFALVVYLIWEIIVLGIVPIGGDWGIYESLRHGRQAADSIAGIVGNSWMTHLSEGLAFFSLLSSFLAQTLGLVHFFADAFRLKSEKNETLPLCILALLPPLLFEMSSPHLFIKALNFAGGICAVVLFGLFPALLCWNTRYVRKYISTYQFGGGKKVLISIIALSGCIVVLQIATMMGFLSGV